jgi:hypothetical protein
MSNSGPICDDCNHTIPVWFINNDLWNRVIPDRRGMLCPCCFISKAEAAGIECTGWELVPENLDDISTKGLKMNKITPEQVLHVSQAAEKAASEVGLELWEFGDGGIFPPVNGKKIDSRTFILVNKTDV